MTQTNLVIVSVIRPALQDEEKEKTTTPTQLMKYIVKIIFIGIFIVTIFSDVSGHSNFNSKSKPSLVEIKFGDKRARLSAVNAADFIDFRAYLQRKNVVYKKHVLYELQNLPASSSPIMLADGWLVYNPDSNITYHGWEWQETLEQKIGIFWVLSWVR